MPVTRPVLALALLSACAAAAPAARAQDLDIPFQKFVLENGLQVVIHEDHSDPVVAVYVSYHVGSAREERGRSGFAHLFEHMLFQGSQHVGDDQHFKLISEAGGTLNGTTNDDRTLYFETLPANQLELALWLEADRMGFLLPAVTQAKLDNQRDVVKNERRQNYENRPYAQARGVVAEALYPPDHPYSWITIGSQEDLTAASLDDVHSFFRRWYGPNNATLAIGGDVDTQKTLALVKKWFGPIARGPEVAKPAPRPVALAQSKRLVMEDKVKLPQISWTWPTVPMGSPEEPALDLLASALAQGKSSVLERAFRIDRPLARDVSAFHSAQELAGTFTISVTAAPGASLDEIEAEMGRVLGNVAREGVSAETLDRLKTREKASRVRRFETVSGRTGSLAVANTFFDDPNHAAAELRGLLAVTPAQVRQAMERWIQRKPAVVMSVVPEGSIALAASGRTIDQVAMEGEITRSKQPPAGPRPSFKTPEIWRGALANGAALMGTRTAEVPLTTISIALPGGGRAEQPSTRGIASLTANLLEEGTKALSTTELAETLDGLGASLSVSADDDEISLVLTTLDETRDAALAILGDVLLEPRFDPADFERIVRERLTSIDTRGDSIRTIAGNVWSRILYGDGTIDGMPSAGTRATVEGLTLSNVRDFHRVATDPKRATVTVVGNLGADDARRMLEPLVRRWEKGTFSAAAAAKEASAARALAAGLASPRVFLVDKPGAAQSEVRIGHLSVATTDADYYPLTVLNYVLGGAFSSRINMNLREDKGYTYGARSSFSGGLEPGPFAASGGIHTAVTKEAVAEFLKELRGILDGITEEELAFAKSALAQSAARQYEGSRARLGLLENVRKYGYPDDYPEQQLRQLDALTVAELKTLARKHLKPESMAILVVGDKAKVMDGLATLGLGEVVELDIDGAPIR